MRRAHRGLACRGRSFIGVVSWAWLSWGMPVVSMSPKVIALKGVVLHGVALMDVAPEGMAFIRVALVSHGSHGCGFVDVVFKGAPHTDMAQGRGFHRSGFYGCSSRGRVVVNMRLGDVGLVGVSVVGYRSRTLGLVGVGLVGADLVDLTLMAWPSLEWLRRGGFHERGFHGRGSRRRSSHSCGSLVGMTLVEFTGHGIDDHARRR
jgi:hypothetical protein